MLSIGEFSKICKVSTKTLRYYEEINLILPHKINPDNGYRYYSIEQLETMLFINRLKSYDFSLEEIKYILNSDENQDEILYLEFIKKKQEIERRINEINSISNQIKNDLSNLKRGKSIMSYLDDIDIALVDTTTMNLLSIRELVHEKDMTCKYQECFASLFKTIQNQQLTIVSPPMVLFHNDEFSPFGLDIEFAIAVKEETTKTREFRPGVCLKTTLRGSYSNLSSVYTKQQERAEKEGYKNNGALYEIYVIDPSQVSDESEIITEVYFPVIKKGQ